MSIVDRLNAAGCVAAADEADELVAAAPDERTLETWIARRAKGEPLAWITGAVLFCGHAVRVAPGVYVPRTQSEELARRAAAVLPHGGTALDLCAGAGAIAVHLMAEVPTATVIGVDLDPCAAVCARANGVPVLVGDLAAPLRGQDRFDVVTAVAPYVPSDDLRLLPSDVQRYEPRRALDGGTDGLDVVRRAVDAATRLLHDGGSLFLELGGEQDDALASPLGEAGFDLVESWCDDDGELRGIACRFQPGRSHRTTSSTSPVSTS